MFIVVVHLEYYSKVTELSSSQSLEAIFAPGCPAGALEEAENDVEMTCQCCDGGSFHDPGRRNGDPGTGLYIDTSRHHHSSAPSIGKLAI